MQQHTALAHMTVHFPFILRITSPSFTQPTTACPATHPLNMPANTAAWDGLCSNCPDTSGTHATYSEPKRVPFDADTALHMLAEPMKVMASALAEYRVGLTNPESSLLQLQRSNLNNELWSAETRHNILHEFMGTLNALEKIEHAVECVSFWRSTGLKCETTDAINRAIESKVAAFKNTRRWLEFLKSNRSGLIGLINAVPAGMTVHELDEGLEPMFKIETCRSDLDTALGQGFQLKTLVLRSADPPRQTPHDSNIDLDSGRSAEACCDELIR